MNRILTAILILLALLPAAIARATIHIAASDSLQRWKDVATVTCTGVEDQAVINRYMADDAQIVLYPGTYWVSNTQEVTIRGSGVRLEGYGATLKLTAGTAVTAEIIKIDTQSDVQIVGLTLDGNKENQTGSGNTSLGECHFGIYAVDCTDIQVRDCTVKNLGSAASISGYGIYFFRTSQSRVDNCYFTGNKREGTCFYFDSDYNIIANCISYKDSDRSYVIHSGDYNIIANSISIEPTGRGIDINDGHYNQIIGCTLYKTGSHSVYVITGSSTTLIQSCQIINSSTVGIYVLNTTTEPVNTNIIDCVVYDAYQAGIRIDGETTTVRGCHIENNGGVNNTIYDTGIILDDDADNCIIEQNRFLAGGPHQDSCINLLAGATGNFIKNNYFSGGYVVSAVEDAGTGTIYSGNGTDIPIVLGDDADDAYTITVELNGGVFTNAGDDDVLTIMLPTATPGLSFTVVDVMDGADIDLFLDCQSAEHLVTPAGVTMSNGEQYQSKNDTFAKITATCYVAGIWHLENSVGTWTEETP